MDDSARNVLLFTDGEEGSLSFIALDKKVANSSRPVCVAGAGRRALRRHGETERCVSIVSWPDRIELALRTAAGTAYAMLPGGPAGTMCSESLWVANPELPLLCLPGPYQNVGAQEQRGLCSGVRDLAGASPYGARRWPFPTAD